MGFAGRIVEAAVFPWRNSLVGRKPVVTQWDECAIPGPDGGSLFAHVHRPAVDQPCPVLVLVPGASDSGGVFDGRFIVDACELAALGFAVIHYDPSGRGNSGGSEDFWGLRHQAELADVIDWSARQPWALPGRTGVMSFSIGIIIAAGGISRINGRVNYLFDWEGPSNRFNITMNDTHPPLRQFPTSDMGFWSEREPVRMIPGITCSYFRYQAGIDHIQGRYKGHAIELVNAATQGSASRTRMNDNAPGIVFDPGDPGKYSWVGPLENHRWRIYRYLLEFSEHVSCTR